MATAATYKQDNNWWSVESVQDSRGSMAVLSKFLTGQSSQVNFKNFAEAFNMFLDVNIEDSEAMVKFLESEGDQIPDKELLISQSDDKIWFYKEVKRIIEEKSVNVEDVLRNELERKAKFKPYGTKLDWTNVLWQLTF